MRQLMLPNIGSIVAIVISCFVKCVTSLLIGLLFEIDTQQVIPQILDEFQINCHRIVKVSKLE